MGSCSWKLAETGSLIKDVSLPNSKKKVGAVLRMRSIALGGGSTIASGLHERRSLHSEGRSWLKDLNLLNVTQLTPLEVLGLQVLGPQVLGLAVLGPKVLELHTARWRLMMLASMTVFLRSVLEVHLV